MANSPDFYLILSALVFTIGLVGLMLRKNPLIMFMAIELMLNAANLAFLTFSRFPTNTVHAHGGPSDGPAFIFVVVVIAAAEAVVGLAIIITIFRNRRSIDVDALAEMKG